jgi:hypothetical protein
MALKHPYYASRNSSTSRLTFYPNDAQGGKLGHATMDSGGPSWIMRFDELLWRLRHFACHFCLLLQTPKSAGCDSWPYF